VAATFLGHPSSPPSYSSFTAGIASDYTLVHWQGDDIRWTLAIPRQPQGKDTKREERHELEHAHIEAEGINEEITRGFPRLYEEPEQGKVLQPPPWELPEGANLSIFLQDGRVDLWYPVIFVRAGDITTDEEKLHFMRKGRLPLGLTDEELQQVGQKDIVFDFADLIRRFKDVSAHIYLTKGAGEPRALFGLPIIPPMDAFLQNDYTFLFDLVDDENLTTRVTAGRAIQDSIYADGADFARLSLDPLIHLANDDELDTRISAIWPLHAALIALLTNQPSKEKSGLSRCC